MSSPNGKPKESNERRRSHRRNAPATLDDDRLLDVHEAAAILGLKPSTLYDWAYKRRLQVVKLGGPRGALRFRLRDVQHFIEQCVRPALGES